MLVTRRQHSGLHWHTYNRLIDIQNNQVQRLRLESDTVHILGLGFSLFWPSAVVHDAGAHPGVRVVVLVEVADSAAVAEAGDGRVRRTKL